MKANIKNLKEASERADIRKSSIEGDCIHYGITKKDKEGKTKSKISLKTYYLMRKGSKVKEEFFEAIVQLINKKQTKKHYQINDIIDDQESSPKIESCYLSRVDSTNDLRKYIAKSIEASISWEGKKIFVGDELRKKVFYDIQVNPTIKTYIEDLFKTVISLKKNEFKKNLPIRQQIHQDVIDRVNKDEIDYFLEDKSFDRDVEDLEIQSKGNNSINQLKDFNICLYVGNISIPIVDFENRRDPDLEKEVDEKDKVELGVSFHPDGYWQKFTPVLKNRTYTIFYFAKCLGDTVEATYHKPQSFEEQKKILKKNFRDLICFTYINDYGITTNNPDPIPSIRDHWAEDGVTLQFTADESKFDFKRVDNQSLQRDIDKELLEEREKDIKNQEKSLKLDAKEQELFLAQNRMDNE